MNKTILITVSDDRFGRKEGMYRKTQLYACDLLEGLFDQLYAWSWDDILQTDFYQQNKILLDNTDAARNGRAYKPFVILEGLKTLNEGDFLIYADCSPEIWDSVKSLAGYDIEIIKQLTIQNNNILTPFIKWSRFNLKPGELGEATHKNYTLNRCMDKMGLRFYEDAYMCASGMICIRKTPETVALVEEWLKWNCIDECCALGWANIPNDATFWIEESHDQFGRDGYKMGCRHDQSILGLLLARDNHKFVDVEVKEIHCANFLQFCRPDAQYQFIDSLPVLNIGDMVINKQGTELQVFGIYEGKYQVGQNNASMYLASRQTLKKI